MTRHSFKAMATLTGLMAAPNLALAHNGAGQAAGMLHGLGHPVSGLDHLLAMVMVGTFAFQRGGRAVWLVPATFVVLMAAGGVLGAVGVDLPLVEAAIALSVVVLGAVVALRVRLSTAVSMGLVGLFAVFHGHAHGVEMPAEAAMATYAAGFMAATALLHALGVALGFAIARAAARDVRFAAQTVGGVAAVAGVGMLTGVL